MSLSKKIAKFVAATLFTTFLALFVMLISVQGLTSYGTLKPLSKAQFSGQAPQIDAFIEQSCKISQRFEIPVQNEKLSFECSDVKNADALFDKVFDSSYYKNYSCSVLECIREPAVFASAFGNNLVSGAILFSGVLAAIFGVITVLLLEKKIKGLGISLIFVGTNYFGLMLLRNSIPQTQVAAAAALINSLFAGMMTNFLYILIVGVVVAIVGFVTKK